LRSIREIEGGSRESPELTGSCGFVIRRAPLLRSASLQRFPACAVPPERPRSNDPAPAFWPVADPRRRQAFARAVFWP
jgi:hypothetical protein